MAAWERNGIAPNPILALVRGQRIEVQHRFPLRRLSAVLGHRRTAPESARMLGIAPIVVEAIAPPRDERNVVGAVEDGLQGRLIAGQIRAVEPLQGVGVLTLNPGQSRAAFDLLEPKVGVVVWLGEGRAAIRWHRFEHLSWH